MPIASSGRKLSRRASSSARSNQGIATSVAPLGMGVTDLRGDDIALLGELAAPRELTTPEIDGRGSEQSPGPKSRALRGADERLVEAPLCLVEVDPPHPEVPQRNT